MNVASIIDDHDDDAVALISRGEPTTYGRLREQAAAMRGGLAAQGVTEGDRVAIICGNNWYFVVSYLAVLGAGAVAVPLNPMSPTPELTRELAVVGATAAIVGPTSRDAFAAIDRSEAPTLVTVIGCPGTNLEGAADLDDVLAHAPAAIVDRAPDDLAVLMFTSGTAGQPKAAMLTHGNLEVNQRQMQQRPGPSIEASDVAFGVLPLFHVFGLNSLLGLTLRAGASVVLVERFDPTAALETIADRGVTVIVGPPTLWSALASMPDASTASLAGIRIALSGAAKLPEFVAKLVAERLGINVTEGYGLTEASPAVTSSIGTDAPLGSIGTAVPGMELRIVDDDGSDVLIGDEGELWVRGPNVFAGYWEEPDATAAALTDDGWLRTGDIAVVDDEGYLFLVDRAKDLIIVSGFNVYPAEVESVLNAHAAVVEAAVVGVAHPHTGEAVRAFVVPAADRSVEEDELLSHCARELAGYKCPTKITFVDELPHGASGKVLRRELTPDL